MHAMIARIISCLGIAVMLFSCEKPHEAGGSKPNSQAKSQTTGTNRRPQVQAPHSRHELSASLDAAKKETSREARDEALAEVAWNAINDTPDIAAEAFGEISADSLEKIPLIESYVKRLMQENPDQALAWAAGLGTEKERAAAKEQIILILANSDPQRAAKLIPNPISDGSNLDSSARQVLQRLFAKTPAEAANWVASFPLGDARKAEMKTVVSDWVQIDSRAAFSWLATLNNESVRKEATQGMVDIFIEQPREIREAWLKHADPETRRELELHIDQMPEEPEPSTPEELESKEQTITEPAEEVPADVGDDEK